ncbi:MAG: dihydromonapterin reductase [Gammaproteobacteria bacterium]
MSDSPILITGVGQRVGLHLANAFLDRGHEVIGTYRTRRASIDELAKRGAELHCCDFYETDQPQSFIDRIVAKHRQLRAIIHNASDWLPDKAKMDDALIMQRMMDIHVTAPYCINSALAPLLKAANGADIIHLGDYVSSRGSKKHIAYAASKAAQDNLTLSFASLLAPHVKVNSIAPALILFNEHDDDAYKDKTLRKSLMQREGGLDELLHNVDYLMGSHYVTGRILPMDGGRHLV